MGSVELDRTMRSYGWSGQGGTGLGAGLGWAWMAGERCSLAALRSAGESVPGAALPRRIRMRAVMVSHPFAMVASDAPTRARNSLSSMFGASLAMASPTL